MHFTHQERMVHLYVPDVGLLLTLDVNIAYSSNTLRSRIWINIVMLHVVYILMNLINRCYIYDYEQMIHLNATYIFSRLPDVRNDKYVKMAMHIINIHCGSEMSVMRFSPWIPATIILAYTIVRVIYPNERWIITKDKYDRVILLGRDIIIPSGPPPKDVVPICDSKYFIDEMTLLSRSELRYGLRMSRVRQDELDEIMSYPITPDIYDEGVIHDLLSTDPSYIDMIYKAVEDCDIHSLPIPPASIPTLEVSIRLYHTRRILDKIFSDIPPAGCNTTTIFQMLPSHPHDVIF